MMTAKGKRVFVAAASSTGITFASFGVYSIPHLQAGALPLFPGFILAALLFYRDGKYSVSNPVFITFEAMANIVICSLVIWLGLLIFDKRKTC
jgi:hypothetical protein